MMIQTVQEGSLCAQHCLNALLQSDYYAADVLSEFAKELDQSERLLDPAQDQKIAHSKFARVACNGLFQLASGKKPSNCDDSGFFSIQVLQKALNVWNIELRPITSPDRECALAREDPGTQQAFICNFREHWFTIRRIGYQWFNLNSMLSGPELLSDTHLSLFLKQLQQEGYSIFVVIGELPSCEADHLLKLVPAVQKVKPKILTEYAGSSASRSESGLDNAWDDDGDDDANLRRALEESRKLHERDDTSLNEALQLSMTEMQAAYTGDAAPANVDDVRQRRLAHFGSQMAPTQSAGSSATQGPSSLDELSDEQQLAEAIKLSMESNT